MQTLAKAGKSWVLISEKLKQTIDHAQSHRRALCRRRLTEGKNQMTKPKRTAEQQVADEAERRALHPLTSRQKISDSQAEPEFEENYKRLKADRQAREAELKG